MSTIPDVIAQCLDRHNATGSITIALSGGVDSMVLLDAAHRVQQGVPGKKASNAAPAFDFTALHVHHGLSPHADTWANFCQAACDQRGLPLTIVRVSISPANTDGLGVEGAARRARYAAFREKGSAIILAGQHADDQAETVLHQLLRGTGLAGLAAMGEARTLNPGQQLLRPLLHLSRDEIETYARARQLQWVEDESNTDTAYTRNFIRHELLPLVATRFPHYAASLRRAATHAAGSVAMLEDLAKLDLRWDGVNAHADGLDKLGLMRQTNALYYWLGWHNVSPPSHAQMEEWARQLFRESPPDKSHLAGGHDYVIRRSRNVLSLQMKPMGEGE